MDNTKYKELIFTIDEIVDGVPITFTRVGDNVGYSFIVNGESRHIYRPRQEPQKTIEYIIDEFREDIRSNKPFEYERA